MRYLTAAEMREADRRCIEDLGIPGAVLMNNAGAAVFNEIHEGPVGIVCGKGNNGGDGYVVARLALLAGMETHVVVVAQRNAITGDAATFLNAYQRCGGSVAFVEGETNVKRALRALNECAILVDALLGTGVRGEVRGDIRAAIESWPKIRTIAVDLPSGLNADTGEICGVCVNADKTVSFQFAKKGFENPAAKPYIGDLIVADIGIPDVCADDEAWARLKKSGP